MKPYDLIDNIAEKALVKAERKINIPQIIVGPPGSSKSACIKQAIDKLITETRKPWQYKGFNATLRLPTDLSGIPVPNRKLKITDWYDPGFLPREGYGILAFEDLLTAPPTIQNPLMELFLDCRLNDYVLPEGWYVIATTNRIQDKANVQRLNRALGNRLMHIDIEISHQDTEKYWFSVGVDFTVIAYACRYSPNDLYSFDPSRQDYRFPSLRSWHRVSDLLQIPVPDNRLLEEISGQIGQETATKFLAFRRIKDKLPDPRKMLLNPKTCNIPPEIEVLFCLCGAFANLADIKNISAVITIAERFPPEFSVLLVKELERKHPDLAETREVVSWKCSHPEIFFNN